MCYIGATNSSNKSRHTKPYERKIKSNKLEYSTAVGLYCKMNDIKMIFCMAEISISKIILHRFHIDNSEGK